MIWQKWEKQRQRERQKWCIRDFFLRNTHKSNGKCELYLVSHNWIVFNEENVLEKQTITNQCS